MPLAEQGLSYPGCWAYPDMLEVSQTNTQGLAPLTTTESRTHFGMWAIVSSPLILGFDLLNSTAVDAAWPYITNTEIIAVNQNYAGFSGSIFYNSPENTTFSPCTYGVQTCQYPSVQFLYKPQPNDTMAVMMVNNGDSPADLSLHFNSIPKLVKAPAYILRDLWGQQDIDGRFCTDCSICSMCAYVSKGVASRDSVFLQVLPIFCTGADCQ